MDDLIVDAKSCHSRRTWPFLNQSKSYSDAIGRYPATPDP
jgi:hypothetical protein